MHALGWIALFALGAILMVVGIEGRLGSAFGALITPAHMSDTK